jgi:sporulation protein YlmC with PRC-barrel domain
VTGEPVSWKVVEPGWQVIGSNGKEIGKVDEVLGDPEADIFNGLRVGTGLLAQPVYVAAERVAWIREGEIELDIDSV